MTQMFSSISHIHPSAFHASAGPLAPAEAETRGSGALRYQCPVTEAFVLVTDETTLNALGDSAHFRHRCPACSEMHMLTLHANQPSERRLRAHRR